MLIALIAAVLCAAAPSVRAQSDEPVTAGAREVFKAHRDAVVIVSATVEIQLTAEGQQLGQPQQRKVEMTGTIVSDNGWVVVSNSRLDVASVFDGRVANVGGQRRQVSAKSDFTEVKVRLADGTEVPAKVELQDGMLDLAFVRIDTESEEFAGQELSAAPVTADESAQADVLDQVVVLRRTDDLLNYTPVVGLSRVHAVVDKPRMFYAVGGSEPGCPVFTPDGKLLGIGTMRRSGKKAEQIQTANVVLPTSDVAELLNQATASGE
jgi:S1-C subfamily serine protease